MKHIEYKTKGTCSRGIVVEIEDGVIRVNMRSKSVVDVARIAALFGGGGHVRAAGCTCDDPMLLVKENLLEAIRRQLAEGAEG